ncbi:MAG: hypothetical protein P8N76_23170 [Pirellulaceae bacterium]|nr:hypothetical protein [Pirellulaceae bacterium]
MVVRVFCYRSSQFAVNGVVLIALVAGLFEQQLAFGAERKVTGVVTFDGPRPQRQVIRLVGKDGKPTDCHELHQQQLLDENLIVGEDGGIANVFVYVKKGIPKQDYPLLSKLPVLDQIDCMFRPRVQGIRAGQELLMRNSDQLIHNVRSLSLRNRAFNVAQPASSPDRKKSFRRAEREIKIQCDFHPWMTAYIFVMDHPFFAVSDESGKFEFSGLPAGSYTVAAWHEALGEQQKELIVSNESIAPIGFAFQPKQTGQQTASPASNAVANPGAVRTDNTPKKKRRFVKMWKTEDFSSELNDLDHSSIDRGRLIFEEASCSKCHLVAAKGNKLGPELMGVAKRHQGIKLLQQILMPSAEIHKDYQTQLFVTEEGKIITGLVVQENAEKVTVLPNPLKPKETIDIPAATIAERRVSKLSTMPEGLLMNFDRSEILDLIAFLSSTNDSKSTD